MKGLVITYDVSSLKVESRGWLCEGRAPASVMRIPIEWKERLIQPAFVPTDAERLASWPETNWSYSDIVSTKWWRMKVWWSHTRVSLLKCSLLVVGVSFDALIKVVLNSRRTRMRIAAKNLDESSMNERDEMVEFLLIAMTLWSMSFLA